MTLLTKSFQSLRKSNNVTRQIKAASAASLTGGSTTSIQSNNQRNITPHSYRFHSTSAAAASSASNSGSSNIFGRLSSGLSNIHSRYSIKSQQNRVLQASYLFQAIKHQAHNPEWYDDVKTESDIEIDIDVGSKNKYVTAEFRQIHALLSMHLWFVHRRLFTQNKSLDDNDTKKHDNLLLQEELFDIFWNDTRARIRAQGVNELTVNKHMKDAQRATFVQCTQYDHAFSEFPNDVEKRFEVICDAVWRHVLAGEEDADDEMIRRIGAYVEYQLENVVFKMPDDYFNEGRIAWGNIPQLDSNIGSAATTDTTSDTSEESNVEQETNDDNEETLRGMTFMEDNWVQVLTDAGEPYYWNMDSNQTAWSKP